MSVLTVTGLTKNFGGFTAVRDVSMVVEPGEMRGLIGSNGAGKSTLLHLIYGRIMPDGGSIRFGQIDVTLFRSRPGPGWGWVWSCRSPRSSKGSPWRRTFCSGALPKESGLAPTI